MATNSTQQNAADISALSQTVNTMNGTLGTLVKTVYWGFGLSFVALAGLALQGGNIKQDVGKIQGAIESGTLGTTLQEIKKLLERPAPPVEQPAQKSEQPPEKQGSLENLPVQMGNWTGIKAETADKLADALTKTPATKDPVWVYTKDPAAAQALENALKPQ